MVEFMALPRYLRQSHSGTVPNIIHPNGFSVNPGRETNSQNKNEVRRPRLVSFLFCLILILLFDLKQDVPANNRSDNSTNEIKGEKTANKTHNGSIEY